MLTALLTQLLDVAWLDICGSQRPDWEGTVEQLPSKEA
jgi:hypothetical protein